MIRGRLTVSIPGGGTIKESTSGATFVAAIDQAVLAKGEGRVLACKRNTGTSRGECWCGFPLISKNPTIYTVKKYQEALKQGKSGLYVNTSSNDLTKKRLLEELFEELGLNWTVEVE